MLVCCSTLSDYRFETLEPEMNNLGSRVTDVNQVAEQLLDSDNRSKDQIHQTRDQLNNRSELRREALYRPLVDAAVGSVSV